MSLRELQDTLNKKKGRLEQLVQDLDEAQASQKSLLRERKNLEKAQVVIQTVAQLTQQELQYNIGELVTLALGSVFSDPYEFDIEFVPKRGQSEAIISFVRNGQKVHPLNAGGGGVADIAAFALRLSMWSLQRPRTRNLMILDEPFKNINDPTRAMHRQASQMLKEISAKLGIQIIVITLLPELIDVADKVFEVSRVKDKKWLVSKVKER